MKVSKHVPEFRILEVNVSLKNLHLADYNSFLVLWR